MGDPRKFALALALFLITLFFLPALILPIIAVAILRFFLIKIVCWSYHDISGIVGARDALFLLDRFNVFSNSRPDSFITASTVLEGKASVDTIRKWVTENLIEFRDGDGKLKYPELQQVQVKKFGYWWWAWDRNFKVENHVRFYEETQGWELTTGPQLQTLVGRAGNQYTRMDHPFWEFLIVPNYVHGPKDNHPKTAVIIRLSHSYWDGFSAFKMLVQGLCKASTEWIPNYSVPKQAFWPTLQYYAYNIFQSPYNLWNMLIMNDNNILTPPLKDLRHEWIVGVSKMIPTDTVKALKEHHGISFQGVLLAALAQAYTKFQLAKEGKVKKNGSIHITSPFPWPDHPDKICNHWTGGMYKFPIKQETINNSLELLEHGNRIARETTRSSSLVTSYWMIALGGLFPPKVTAACATASGATFLLSNMKGSPDQLNFCGHPVIDIMFWVPLALSGLSVSVLSYKDTFKVGIMADKGILADRKEVQDFCTLISSAIIEFGKLGSLQNGNGAVKSNGNGNADISLEEHNHSG